ncbi:hypothetical protein B0H15DRAFT_820785 [Mycena belliarum]|uniref:Uncharacterized protein n=1 Tax=Mycena belliarum TaxID=1033014 RepID=A0AAD6XXJ4_9AGAR|nr:hypothetical protein B0H15DRAFT_820785 [Mycena belliae]
MDRYRATLAAVAARTGAPLSSLLLSFAVLHEATAVVPLVGAFYAARALGVGERIVATLPSDHDSWVARKCNTWVDDGQKWAARVGRRYGVFGYEKGAPDDQLFIPHDRIAGDIANAVVAYAATKALLPVRIGAALYLSPAFSRAIIDPTRRGFARVFRKGH